MWDDNEGGRAFSFPQGILRNNTDRSVIVFSNFGDLQNIDHSVEAQMEAVPVYDDRPVHPPSQTWPGVTRYFAHELRRFTLLDLKCGKNTRS